MIFGMNSYIEYILSRISNYDTSQNVPYIKNGRFCYDDTKFIRFLNKGEDTNMLSSGYVICFDSTNMSKKSLHRKINFPACNISVKPIKPLSVSILCSITIDNLYEREFVLYVNEGKSPEDIFNVCYNSIRNTYRKFIKENHYTWIANKWKEFNPKSIEYKNITYFLRSKKLKRIII
jgi:hypothetical protein